MTRATVAVRRVTNRVFLLGLDHLYRATMKRHEQAEFLESATAVATTLGVAPADVPIEGYYTETPQLTRYFRLVRGLQAVDGGRRNDVGTMVEFGRLEALFSSRIFGFAVKPGRLLPIPRDALSEALGSVDHWTLPAIVYDAKRAAERHGDYSLVGLAARAADPVVLAALRESVVLYAQRRLGAAMRRPTEWQYVWDVDPELARQAARFVAEFNALLDENLPEPGPDSAEAYWTASNENEIQGRCVAIGSNPQTSQFYHWAVRVDDGGDLDVEEFWSDELWTTARYRQTHGISVRPG